MKFLTIVLLFFIVGPCFSQQWRDSLVHARKLYAEKKYDQAANYYRSAEANAPEEINLDEEIAQSAYKNRDFESAEQLYRQDAISKTDQIEKADAYYNLGNALMKKKNYQEAAEAYKNSLRLDSKNDQTRYNLSEALRQLKDQQEKEKKDNKENKDQNEENEQDNKDNKDQQDNKDSKEDQGNNNSDQQGNNTKEGESSKIPNKRADKLLDQLMKQEAETKRKMIGQKGDKSNSKSGKDW